MSRETFARYFRVSRLDRRTFKFYSLAGHPSAATSVGLGFDLSRKLLLFTRDRRTGRVPARRVDYGDKESRRGTANDARQKYACRRLRFRVRRRR